MDIDDGQGYNDFPVIMVDESLLKTGVEGDEMQVACVIILAISLTNGLPKFRILDAPLLMPTTQPCIEVSTSSAPDQGVYL